MVCIFQAGEDGPAGSAVGQPEAGEDRPLEVFAVSVGTVCRVRPPVEVIVSEQRLKN